MGPTATMDTLNIAVIGANGVGKSSFIQRALRLTRPPPSTSVTAIRMEVEGVPNVVTIFELDLEALDVVTNEPIRWPSQVNGHTVPRVDGTMVLYDVMNKESIKELPQTLCKLYKVPIPSCNVRPDSKHGSGTIEVRLPHSPCCNEMRQSRKSEATGYSCHSILASRLPICCCRFQDFLECPGQYPGLPPGYAARSYNKPER